MSPRRKVYEILKISDRKGTLSRAFDVFLIIMILLNALALILETVEDIYRPFRAFFYYFDLFSILFFTAEYGLRIWTSPEDPRYRHPVGGRLKFFFSPSCPTTCPSWALTCVSCGCCASSGCSGSSGCRVT